MALSRPATTVRTVSAPAPQEILRTSGRRIRPHRGGQRTIGDVPQSPNPALHFPGTFGPRQVSVMLEAYDPDGCQGVRRVKSTPPEGSHCRDRRHAAGVGVPGLSVSLLAGGAPGRQILRGTP